VLGVCRRRHPHVDIRAQQLLHRFVVLRSASDYDAFRKAVQTNPTLHLEARHEREVVEDSFKQLNALFDFVSYFVGTIMAIGATLGAVNSLYSIVDARRRELATCAPSASAPAPSRLPYSASRRCWRCRARSSGPAWRGRSSMDCR